MEKIGEMSMQFVEYRDGIYYYDVTTEVEGRIVKMKLPRYHQLLGWIEIFGLPPQHEWVVLADIEPFTKTAELTIDGKSYTETCVYDKNKEKKTHKITLTREGGGLQETVKWTEHYVSAPNNIKHEIRFEHKDGTYECLMHKSLIRPESLDGDAHTFVRDIIEQCGEPDQLWQKIFETKGVLPEIYYRMFPAVSGVDLTDTQGTAIEVGYLAGKEEIDATHGDWHKLFVLKDVTLQITEDGYISKEVDIEGTPERIKYTYHKNLYRV